MRVRTNRRVKRRDADDANPVGSAAVVGQLDEPGLGFLLFQLDFVARQNHHVTRCRIVLCLEGQPHLRAFGAANQFDDFGQFHVHDVDGRLIALRDGDDALFFVDLPAFVRRPAGDERVNGAVTIVLGQLRADAAKLQAHADAKIRRVLLVQVIRVRVVGVGERDEIKLQHVVAVPIGEIVQVPVVTPRQLAGDFRAGGFGQRQNRAAVGRREFAVQFFLQILVTQLLAPQFLRLGQVLRIRRVAAVKRDALVGVETEPVLFEQLVDIIRVLPAALQKPPENFKRGREVGPPVAADGEPVEVCPVVREPVNVRLQEVFAARVERCQIAVEKFFGHGLVEQLRGILPVLQKLRGLVGDARVIGSGLQSSRRRRGGRGGFGGRAPGGDEQAKRHRKRDGREIFCLQATHGHGHNFDPM